jgi:hypothetical protein
MQAERKMFFARRREKGSADRPASAFWRRRHWPAEMDDSRWCYRSDDIVRDRIRLHCLHKRGLFTLRMMKIIFATSWTRVTRAKCISSPKSHSIFCVTDFLKSSIRWNMFQHLANFEAECPKRFGNPVPEKNWLFGRKSYHLFSFTVSDAIMGADEWNGSLSKIKAKLWCLYKKRSRKEVSSVRLEYRIQQRNKE